MANLRWLGAICITISLLGLFSFVQTTSVKAQKTERPELVIQDGHLGNVQAVAFSPNGRILASAVGIGEGGIKLWEANSGRLIRNLRGEEYGVRRLAFSPDGNLLAASNNGSPTCQIWDINSGKLVRNFDEKKGGQVQAIAFSPIDKTFAFSSGSIYLWDLSKDTLLQKLGHDVTAIVFSPNGKIIAGVDREGSMSSDQDRKINLWQTDTGQLLRSIPANADSGPKVIGFSPDGKTVAVITDDRTIDLWDVGTGNSIRSLSSPDYNTRGGDLKAVRYSLDGKRLFVLFNSNTGNVYEYLDVWDLTSGKVTRQIPSQRGMEINDDVIAFSADEKIFATGFFEGIRLSDTSTGNTVRVIEGHDKSTASLIINPLQKTILLGASDAPASVWDANQSLICKLTDDTGYFRGVKFSPDGKTFVLDHVSGASSFWNQRDCKNLFERSEIDPEKSVFAPDGKHIAVIEEKSIKLYSAEKQELLRVLRGHTNRIASIAFSPDGKLLATASEDRTVKVWNLDQGQTLYSLDDPTFKAGAVAFSPDGKILASADGDVPFYVRRGGRKIKLWDISSGKLLRSFGDHDLAIKTLAFSSDGKLLASSSKDKTVRIWNLSSGQLLQKLDGHPNSSNSNNLGIWFITFSPDGRTLITRDDTPAYDSTVNFWEVSSGKLLNQVSGDPDIRAIQFTPDGKSIVIATRTRYKDTMTNLYSTGGELLVSVVGFPNGTWIVTTPDGLFDGSPETLSRINWRFAANEVAPVEVFFNEFYYPGLLIDILNGKRPKASSDITRKDRRQPEVRFLSNAGPQTGPEAETPLVSDRNFTVRLEVNEIPSDKDHPAGSGAKDVRLFRNGSLVKIWRGNVLQKGSKAILETVVPITSGENRFTAYCFNRDNVKSLDAQMLVRGNDSLSRKGTAYILTVGINRYSNSQYNLKYAVADAEAFSSEVQRQLIKLNNFSQIQVVPLLDQQATKANVLAVLQRLAGVSTKEASAGPLAVFNKIRQAQPEDAVILYFASHGTARQNQFYLIPHDMGYAGPRTKLTPSDIQNLLDHSLSDRELDQAMEGINAGHLLLVIDACNSGQALEAEEKRRGPMNSKGLAQLAYEKGMYILTASQSYQAALEATQLGHGLLTYALIEEGLKKASADNEPNDGQLTVRELLNFASERVPQIQIEKLQEARGLGLNLSFVGDEDQKLSLEDRDLQRPRAFYRRELITNPFIIALLKGLR